jgi:EmrB/QacA subfamily drug resistance transporter
MEPVQSSSMPKSVSKNVVLFVSAVGSFLTPFMGSSTNIALPAIQEQFGLDAVLLSWVQTSYLLSAAVAMVPLGRLADIHGRKKALVWGMTVFTISSLLCGLSMSAAMLIGARILQGVGSAMIFAAGLAILTAVFPLGERGRAIGIAIASVYIGLSMGPVLGGVLTGLFGWRSVFLVIVPLGLFSVILILWKIKAEWAEAKGQKFDVIGAVIFGLALISLMMGLTGLPAPSRIMLVVIGAAGIAVFVWYELRLEYPVFQVRLFRDSRVFAFSNLAALLHYSATFGVVFLLSLYLQYIKALTPQEAGAILVIQPVMMAVFSPLAGRLSDRIEPGWVASSGMALTAAGLFMLSFLGQESGTVYLMAALFILGLGFALFSSPNTNAIMSSVPKQYLGIAAGAVSTMRLIGQMTSMGMATLIFALVIGHVKITPAAYPQFLWCVQTAFTIFGGFCVAGIAASLVRGRLRD